MPWMPLHEWTPLHLLRDKIALPLHYQRKIVALCGPFKSGNAGVRGARGSLLRGFAGVQFSQLFLPALHRECLSCARATSRQMR